MRNGMAVVGVAVLAIAGVFAALYAQRWVNDLNREAVQHTQQYVEAKQSLLLQLIDAYEDPDATEGQREATTDRFCHEVVLIEPDHWVGPIARFEAEHC